MTRVRLRSVDLFVAGWLVSATGGGTATLVARQGPPVTVVAPTFSEHVAPIVFAKCVTCHRPGEVAPMPLITYRDVRPWTKSIREHLLAQAMPPFHSDPKYGVFPNNPRLTPSELDTIVRWVDAGAPEGDPARLPRLPVLPKRR